MERIEIHLTDIEGAPKESCYAMLKGWKSFKFENTGVMEACAKAAEVDIIDFNDYHKKGANHSYETQDFIDGQVEGVYPRLFSSLKELRSMSKDKHKIKVKSLINSPLDDISKAVSGQHYNDIVPGFQYMEMMEHMLSSKSGVESHLLGQVYKYLMRAGKKDDVEQEYRKARWYLNCLVKYKQEGAIDCEGND